MARDLSGVQVKNGDELWDLRYRELKEYRDEHGNCNVPANLVPLGKWVQNRRQDYKNGRLSNERIARLEIIGFVWNLEEQWWSERFDELTNYKSVNGDCNVPAKQSSLGTWVDNQRQSFKKGKLSQERADLLDRIGFSWEPIDEAWKARFDELVDFKNDNGDCNVPRSQGPLGTWVDKQRVKYKSGKLSQERVDLLESIFDELVDFKCENGDCNVPSRQGPLGVWVGFQRQYYKKGKLSQERVDLLDSIGFSWEPFDEAWTTRFDELVDFKNDHGDCNVPQGQGSLGMWVNRQREEFKAGRLSEERIARLESIGFVWDMLEQEWLERFGELTKYKTVNGDCSVPQSQGSLGVWVDTQRQSFKKGKLPQERVDLLESIGFSWEPTDEAWTARFDELVDFKDENGDCNVPKVQGPLGRWVDTQRQSYKKGKLSQERIGLLKSIGFEWVLVPYKKSWKLDERWKTVLTELVRYLIEHGTCNVPRKYGPLGSWVSKQRQEYKDGSMSQLRKDYLGSIGFAWKLKQVGKECSPAEYSKPDPEAIAGVVGEETRRHENDPFSTAKDPRKCLAKALQEFLDSDTARLIQTYDKPQKIGVKWQTRYTELVHYLIAHGNCNVPRGQGVLGDWVNTQRANYREGRLSQPRKEYLEIIGFVWTTKRVGRERLSDLYSKSDPKAIARIIADEKSQHDVLPPSAPEGLKTRVNADRDLVEALQEYLDKLENR